MHLQVRARIMTRVRINTSIRTGIRSLIVGLILVLPYTTKGWCQFFLDSKLMK